MKTGCRRLKRKPVYTESSTPPVFQNSIDYSKVKVHNGAFMPFAGNNAMTPNGEMYFPHDYYRPDYSLELDAYKAWFIHEMTHVWQCQLGYVVWWGGIKIQIKGGYKVDPGQQVARAYKYDLTLDAGKPMSDFNMEQQGDLVSHYFEAYFLPNGSREKNEQMPHLPFLQNILANFIRSPSDVTLLPNATKIEP